MVLRVALPLVAMLAIVLASPRTLAQGNDRSAPTGGRTELMGDTGIALGEDGASPFSNPATIVRIRDSSIAFSVNFFSLADTHFSSWHQPGGVDATHFGNVNLGGTGISSAGFNVLPSTLCLFFTLSGANAPADLDVIVKQGRQKLALCLATVESQSTGLAALGFNGTTSLGTTAQVQSVAQSFTRLQGGPTYSIAFTDNFTVGLSLDGAFTTQSFIADSTAISSAAGGAGVQSSLGAGGQGHSADLTAILGATYRFGSVTIGASGELPSLHVLGGYSGIFHSSYTLGTTNTATLTNGSGDFSAPPPVRVGLGVGTRLRKITMEADASFDFGWGGAFTSHVTGTTTTLGATGPTTTPLTATYNVATNPVLNLAAGAEYFLANDFSLIGGLSSNLTSLPGLQPTLSIGNLTPTRTSWVNASFGIGSYGGAGSLLLGAVLGFGWGQALAINPYVVPNNWAVVDTQSYSALLVLAGSVNFKTVGRAVKEVENTVKTGNPDTETKTLKDKPAPTAPKPEAAPPKTETPAQKPETDAPPP